jgi:hypothetical protein
MSLKTIITSALVLGTSSAALASPSVTTWRTPAPIVRDHRDGVVLSAGANLQFGFTTPASKRPVKIVKHRYDRTPRGYYVNGGYTSSAPYVAPVEPSYGNGYGYGYDNAGWSMISAVNRMSEDQGTRSRVKPVGAANQFQTIRIDATRGSTFIKMITVYLTNGQYQQLMPNVGLDERNPSFEFSLGGPLPIDTIIIDGSTNDWQSAFSVQGS